MSKGKVIVIVLIVAIVGLLLISPRFSPFVISGYDGPVAEIVEVEHEYDTERFYNLEVNNIGTAAWIDTGVGDVWDFTQPAGVRLEINSAPRVIEDTLLETIVKSDIDEIAETNTTKTWEVHEVICEMGMTFSTWEGGLMSLSETTFWIELEENAFSIFSNANQSLAYMIFVETAVEASIVGSFSTSPQAGGSPVDLTTVEEFDTPQWIIDSGYTKNLDGFKRVKFPVVALSGAPTTIAGMWRQESSATLTFQISVILFGIWERVAPYTPWTWPKPPDIIGALIAFFVQMIWLIFGLIATVIVVKVMPGGASKVAGLVVVWVFVAYMNGWLDPLINQFLGSI